MTGLDDHALLDRWRAGEPRAGELLVERYFDLMYRFFHSKLDAEADELVQATFLACLSAKDRFRGDASFRTFLYAIAKHQLYAAVRARGRAGREVDVEQQSIADLVSTPRAQLARHEDHERLIGHLRRLPIEHQTLLELHYWSELSIGELAVVFEAPEVTIRSRLHRARNALRALLQADAVTAPRAASVEEMDAWARTLTEA